MSPVAALCACVFIVVAGAALADPAPRQSHAGHLAHSAADDASATAAHASTTDAQSSAESASGPSTPLVLQGVEVHGVAPDAAIKAQQRLTPGAVSIVNGARFRERPVNNMAGALRYVPGVLAESDTGGDAGLISIRGSNLTALNYDNSGVTLFEDGLPVTTADGANHNRLLDPLAAESVIVANGPNALAYGASDIGGAIDFIPYTARNSDPDQVYLMGGDQGLAEGRISAGGIAGNLDGIVTLDAKHFGGYRQHSRENRQSVYGNVGWRPSRDFRMRFLGTFIDSRQQLAGALTRAEFDTTPRMADPAYLLGNHQLNVRTGRFAAKGTWDLDATRRLEFGLSYAVQSLFHPIVDTFDFSTDPPTDPFSLLISTVQRTAGGMLRYDVKADDHDVLVGVNLARTTDIGGNYDNDGGHKGPRTDDVDQRANNVTLFALDRWRFTPRWTFVYGAQGVVTDRNVEDVSLVHDSVRDQRRTYRSLNPRVGLIYTLGRTSEAFVNVSRVYQPPDNFALDNDVTQDDSSLAAMHGISYEIGTRGTRALHRDGGSWHWSLSVYRMRLHDEILSVEDPAEPGNMLSTNYPRTTHAGVEALVGAASPVAGGVLRIEPLIAATWNDFSFDHDPTFGNNRLPFAPHYVVHAEVMVHDPASGVYAGPTFEVAGSRYADMANSYRVGTYGLVGLRAGIQRRRWSLYVEATNLTNRTYANELTVLTHAASDARVLNPGAPRAVFAGFNLHY